MAQFKELLTQYGPLEYIWFDHAQTDGGLSHVDTTAWCKKTSSRVVSSDITMAKHRVIFAWVRWGVPRRLGTPQVRASARVMRRITRDIC